MAGSVDDEPARAATFVQDYIAAHWEWEVWAFRLWLADGDIPNPRTTAQIQDAYDALLRTFCSDKVVGQHPRPAFGDPPDPNPNATEITSVRSQGKRTIVRTSEQPDPDLEPAEYEYVVEESGERLVLALRRRRDLSGRWISI